MGKIKIKILGPGCPKCQALENRVREVVQRHNFDAEVEKVQNLMEIMKYGVMITPALIINEKLVASGTPLPSSDKITEWIRKEAN
ncbi:MAG: thioredoxin family protein [Candidatus Kapaibacteriota bacterium]